MRTLTFVSLVLFTGCSSLQEKLHHQVEPIVTKVARALVTGNPDLFAGLIAGYDEGIELFYLNGWGGGRDQSKAAAKIKIKRTVTPDYYRGLRQKCLSDFTDLAAGFDRQAVYQGFVLEKFGDKPGSYAYARLQFRTGSGQVTVKFATYKTLGRWTLTDSPYLAGG